ITVLEVISSSETFLETTLGFLKEFTERRSYSEIRDDYQQLVMLTMVDLPSQSSIIHWLPPGSFQYTHWIAKLLYAIIIYIFCNQCDQEGPRKPFMVSFNIARKKETQVHRFTQFGVLLYTME